MTGYSQDCGEEEEAGSGGVGSSGILALCNDQCVAFKGFSSAMNQSCVLHMCQLVALLLLLLP